MEAFLRSGCSLGQGTSQAHQHLDLSTVLPWTEFGSWPWSTLRLGMVGFLQRADGLAPLGAWGTKGD